eukprot:1510505-Amphidinium_carterae.1
MHRARGAVCVSTCFGVSSCLRILLIFVHERIGGELLVQKIIRRITTALEDIHKQFAPMDIRKLVMSEAEYTEHMGRSGAE